MPTKTTPAGNVKFTEPVAKAAAASRPRTPAARRPSDEPQAAQRIVNGQQVIQDDDLISPGLSARFKREILVRGIRVLTLQDGSKVFGCADCPITGAQGEIGKHRKEQHPDENAGPTSDPDDSKPAAIPKQKPGRPPSAVLQMTIGELLHLGEEVHKWEQAVEATKAEYDKKLESCLQQKLDAEAKAAGYLRELTKLTRALEKLGWVPKVED